MVGMAAQGVSFIVSLRCLVKTRTTTAKDVCLGPIVGHIGREFFQRLVLDHDRYRVVGHLPLHAWCPL